jgi:ATP-dependent Clp protease ATP-binding subunit ClpX
MHHPNYIFGIDGYDGVHPLIYFQDSSSGITYHRLFNNPENKVSPSNEKVDSNLDSYFRDIVNKMATGEIYKIQRPTNQQDNSRQQEEAENQTENSHPIKTEIISGDVDWRKPQTIIKYLDEYVIGQQNAKEKVAVAFSNYMMKVLHPELQIEKNNVLFLGPTGSGKTLMANILAQKAGIPFVSTEVSTKSAEGYKGTNFSTAFKEMRDKTKNKAPNGIMLIDEIDKISYGRRDTFGEAIQNNLISWTDDKHGETIHFDSKGINDTLPLNTKNIFFIAAGAFAETKNDHNLESIIEERIKGGKPTIGIGAEIKNTKKIIGLIHEVRAEDIIKYGLKPELVGRFPINATFNELTTDDKIKILTQSKDSILISYQNIFNVRELKIELGEEIPRIIAESCTDGTGARELKSKCQELFEPFLLQPTKFINNNGIIKINSELAKEILYKHKKKIA